MKKLLLSAVFALITLTAFSQNQYVNEGKWLYKHYDLKTSTGVNTMDFTMYVDNNNSCDINFKITNNTSTSRYIDIKVYVKYYNEYSERLAWTGWARLPNYGSYYYFNDALSMCSYLRNQVEYWRISTTPKY